MKADVITQNQTSRGMKDITYSMDTLPKKKKVEHATGENISKSKSLL